MSVPQCFWIQVTQKLLLPMLCAVLALMMLNSPVQAQRLNWRPTDFRPLTELPWREDSSLPMHQVLEMIFKEPNSAIRDAVLVGYLRTIPLNKFESAFALSTTYEGCQNPDDLVTMFLEIWAQRDPEAAWKNTQELFGAVVMSGSSLGLDNWERPKIRVVDHKALQTFSFWLKPYTLDGFRVGLQKSDLDKGRRKQLLKLFADRFIDAFAELGGDSDISSLSVREAEKTLDVLTAFEAELRGNIVEERSPPLTVAQIEASCMRWLSLQPGKAREIIQTVEREARWPVNSNLQRHPFPCIDSFLLLWSKLDSAAMLKWTEAQDIKGSRYGISARAFLMSTVDEATRQRWLGEAKATDTKDGSTLLHDLLLEWAEWNPEHALKACVAFDDSELLEHAGSAAVFSPINSYAGSHWGLGIVRDFDLRGAGAKWIRENDYSLGMWGITIMEQWSGVDVGEAARYGFHFLTVVWPGYNMPREDLIKMFSGDPKYCRDSDMIDRTFCCMRFWAMWKPDEMRKWIETIEEADMCKALTWTLEHPWGSGEE